MPPDVSVGSEANVNAVLCMSGEAGTAMGPSPRSRSSSAAAAGPADQSTSTPQVIARVSRERRVTPTISYITPFGSPVVPPVYERYMPPDLGIRSSGGWLPISSS